MKILIPLFALMTSSVFAVDLKEGTYRGETVADKKPVELFVKEYPGREGSMLAILIKDKFTGFAYVVDKFSENKYGMTPLVALKSAVIGMTNTDPSLGLSIVKEKNKEIIQIMSNNSDNSVGVKESIKLEFKDKSSRSKLAETDEGTYKTSDMNNALTVTAQNSQNEAVLNVNTKEISGEFILREVRPSLHLILKSVMTKIGVEVSDYSNLMGFFLQSECVFGKGDHFVMMESTTGKLTYYKKR